MDGSILRELIPYDVRKKQENIHKLYGYREKESRVELISNLKSEINNVCVMLRTKYQKNFETYHKIRKVDLEFVST